MPEFIHKPVQVSAEQLIKPAQMMVNGDVFYAKKGDWLLTMQDGSRKFKSNRDFRDFYDPADRIAEAYLNGEDV